MINLRYLTDNYPDILQASEVDKMIAGVQDIQFVNKYVLSTHRLTTKYPYIITNKIERFVYKVNTFKYFAVDYVEDYFVWEVNEVVPNYGYETTYI